VDGDWAAPAQWAYARYLLMPDWFLLSKRFCRGLRKAFSSIEKLMFGYARTLAFNERLNVRAPAPHQEVAGMAFAAIKACNENASTNLHWSLLEGWGGTEFLPTRFSVTGVKSERTRWIT